MADCSISIIIPAYNVEKYLKAALDSIKEQSELPDEVILIDDGSTDRTLEVAEAFEFPVSYQILSIENSGQGNARNVGVRLASSKYVYFFDSDDLLTTNCISSIKKHICRNQHPDIVLFSGKSFNDPEYQGNRWVNYYRGFSDVFVNRSDFLDQALFHNALFCSPCLYVSKKSIWGPQGLEFSSNFLEDEALFYPVLFACNTFLVLNEVFFLRRNREGSTMTMSYNTKHLKGALNCMQTGLVLYGEEGLTPRERWHISKRLEFRCIVYILMARKIGLPVDVLEVVNAIVKTRNLSLALKALVYYMRADQSDTVRSIGGAIKRLGRLAKK